jgi:hypothetical protein
MQKVGELATITEQKKIRSVNLRMARLTFPTVI